MRNKLIKRKSVGKFVKIMCTCGAEQTVFNRASTEIKCWNCGEKLSISTGGKCKFINCVVKDVLL